MKFLISIYILLCSYSAIGQIKIPDVGDGWKAKIDSALTVVKTNDLPKYKLIINVCNRIDFWNASFATTESKTIIVPTKELQAGVINDLAAILVHESLHLFYEQNHLHVTVAAEEADCYFYEFDFLSKIPNVEPWLLKNAYKQYLKFKL
jgi:hypothetical protein